MARQDAKAITFSEFNRRRGGGGRGPGGGDHDGLLSSLWKRWATRLIGEKLQHLEKIEKLTPQQFVDLNCLKAEFEQAALSGEAAYKAVRRHSLLLNNRLVNRLVPA